MKKLTLDLNVLRIERFDVEPDAVVGEGTVMANQLPASLRGSCGPDTCYPQASCNTGQPCRFCGTV